MNYIKYTVSFITFISLIGSSCWGASKNYPLISNSEVHDQDNAWQAQNQNNPQQAANNLFNKTSINGITSFGEISISDITKIAPPWSTPTLINDEGEHSTHYGIRPYANILDEPIVNAFNGTFQNSKTSITMEHLPPEIITSIAEFLNPQSLMQMAQVNKQFSEIIARIIGLYSKQLLQQHNNNPDRALLTAATNNMPYAINYLIQQKANVNTRDDNGRSPLMWAADKNNHVIVAQLLKAKADIRASDRLGYTALMVAKDQNNEVVAEILETITKNLEAQEKCVNRKYVLLGCIGTITLTLAFVFIGHFLCSTDPSRCNSLNHTLNSVLLNNTR